MVWPFDGVNDEEDRSLIEISNDDGDHWVADIPTSGVKATEQSLRAAGIAADEDEKLLRMYYAAKLAAKRDSAEYRFRSARVVDETEDLEDSYDREHDKSDLEPSEQPAWRFW